MRCEHTLGFWLSAALAVGCWSEPTGQSGLTEPLRVRYADPTNATKKDDAQFVAGELPGTPPLAPHTHVPDAGAETPPQITASSSFQSVFSEGEAGWSVSGDATNDTSSVAFALQGVGTGYWVIPIGGPDPATGDLTWSALIDLGDELPPGHHDLDIVAIDGRGVAGPRYAPIPFCMLGNLPDNLQECAATRIPPDAVISLTWDTNVDLDLQVLAPDGTLAEPKHPYTGKLTDAGTVPGSAGVIDRDSDANCIADDIRTEDLVWKAVKPHGSYGIYVNLFSACGQAAVRFDVSVYTAVANPDGGTPYLKKWASFPGELLGSQANGGSARGLYVSQFVF